MADDQEVPAEQLWFVKHDTVPRVTDATRRMTIDEAVAMTFGPVVILKGTSEEIEAAVHKAKTIPSP